MSPLATTEEFDIEVELAESTWVPINDMTGFTKDSSRDVARTRVFMRALPHSKPGAKEITISVSGLVNTDDPGQMRVRSQEAINGNVNIRVQPRGPQGGTPEPAGFAVLCSIGSMSYGSSADDDYQTWSFDLVPVSDPVVVGDGPIL
jgi:hypothetical protein